MAIIRSFEVRILQVDAKHSEACATYVLGKAKDGERFLQSDTYGSEDRKLRGKQSQSIRLTLDAVQQLKSIIDGIVG